MWRVLVVVLPCGFLVGVIALGMNSPGWARIVAVFGAVMGAVAGLVIARRANRGVVRRDGWLTWVLVGGSGPFLADAPDRVMVIVMAFLTGLIVVLIGDAERQRRITR